MARRFSPADAAACVAAGVGAWFTRASLDVFAGSGGDARVAMLPAPVELVGLVALACLSAFLLRAILSRGRPVSTSSPGTAPVPHLLLPLLPVAAIAMPYVPWLPDAAPAWRALAGPVRFALWGLVCGQVIWIGIDAAGYAAARRSASLTRHSDGARAVTYGDWRWMRHSWPAVVVLLASLSAGAALAGGATAGAFGGDGEPGSGVLPLAVRLALGAIVSTLIWLSAERAAGSRAAATTAWLAIAGAAPFLLTGIFTPTAFAAAACVVLAAGWPAEAGDARMWPAVVRASVLAVLAWLDVRYIPLAIVLAGGLAWKMRGRRGALMAAAAALLAALARAALVSDGWGAILGSHEPVWWTAAAVLVDQQDGALVYAPAVALAVPGLWRLWRDGGTARVTALEAAGGTAAMLLTAGWHGGAARVFAIPGATLMPALPLLVVPIARWLRHGTPAISREALARLLVLWGVVATASLPLARGGTALLHARSGASGLLEWLAPSRDLVRVVPMAPTGGADPLAFAVSALIWTAVGATLWWIIARTRPASHAGAAVVVTVGVLAALSVGSVAVEQTLGDRLPPRVRPALRAEVRMLDGFDARRRPWAVAYDGWRTLPAAAVPSLFSFDATPGSRRHPQPLRVLLNTRLALPAGEYVVTLQPGSGAGLNGRAGLQVGRMGPPMREWSIAAAPGQPWSATFTLPVDASFVGLRTTPAFESTVAALRIQPARIVNDRDRRDLPAVLSSATYRDVMVTFHGDQVYAERNGFWVRGRSTLLATFAPPEKPERPPGVRLSLHGGASPTTVRFQTTTWGTTIALEPGVSRELHVPALRGQSLLPVRITPDGGFVPAEADGSADRRLLGCWIEVLG